MGKIAWFNHRSTEENRADILQILLKDTIKLVYDNGQFIYASIEGSPNMQNVIQSNMIPASLDERVSRLIYTVCCYRIRHGSQNPALLKFVSEMESLVSSERRTYLASCLTDDAIAKGTRSVQLSRLRHAMKEIPNLTEEETLQTLRSL